MVNQILNEYAPDFVSPPGETLQETLETIGMSQAELADRTGKAPKTINEIIQGKAPITPETALQLERVLGVPARFWNNREGQYREFLAQAEERRHLASHADWLKRLPLKSLLQFGFIQPKQDEVDQLREVLRFFGVASPDQWDHLWLGQRAVFRQSGAFQANPEAVATWLRTGELLAQKIECATFDAARFRSALSAIRRLTNDPPQVFQPEMVRLCADAGVALVFVPEFPQIRASGAARWLTPTKALVQLSLRCRSDDQLWFTFFHEAGHVLLHGKRDVFIDDGDADGREKEQEADRFAANHLVPAAEWRRFAKQERYSKDEIRSFAVKQGIAPGVVVGRLQHEGKLPHRHCNDLKRRIEWDQDASAPEAELGSYRLQLSAAALREELENGHDAVPTREVQDSLRPEVLRNDRRYVPDDQSAGVALV